MVTNLSGTSQKEVVARARLCGEFKGVQDKLTERSESMRLCTE